MILFVFFIFVAVFFITYEFNIFFIRQIKFFLNELAINSLINKSTAKQNLIRNV